MYFNFTLIFFSLRSEVIRLVTEIGYKIILYLLINYFIDKYFELDGWSWNDFLTSVLLFLEYIIRKYRKYMYIK
jgi:hypothetical protein